MKTILASIAIVMMASSSFAFNCNPGGNPNPPEKQEKEKPSRENRGCEHDTREQCRKGYNG